MKNNLNSLLVGIGIFFVTISNCQVSTSLNTGVQADYLGWDVLTSSDLNIKVENPFDIEFIVPGTNFSTSIIDNGLEVGPAIGTATCFSVLNLTNSDVRCLKVETVLPPVQTQPLSIAGSFNVRADGGENYGVYGIANSITNPNENIGIQARVCTQQGQGIAVYGEAPGVVGTNWAAVFQGDIYTTGNWAPPSDVNLKHDISEIDNSLGIVGQLTPKSYYFRTDEYAQLGLATGLHYGFIAQDVSQFLPELVKHAETPQQVNEDDNLVLESYEFDALNYLAFIPIVIDALGERQEIIDQQIADIEALESAIEELLLQME